MSKDNHNWDYHCGGSKAGRQRSGSRRYRQATFILNNWTDVVCQVSVKTLLRFSEQKKNTSSQRCLGVYNDHGWQQPRCVTKRREVKTKLSDWLLVKTSHNDTTPEITVRLTHTLSCVWTTLTPLMLFCISNSLRPKLWPPPFHYLHFLFLMDTPVGLVLLFPPLPLPLHSLASSCFACVFMHRDPGLK